MQHIRRAGSQLQESCIVLVQGGAPKANARPATCRPSSLGRAMLCRCGMLQSWQLIYHARARCSHIQPLRCLLLRNQTWPAQDTGSPALHLPASGSSQGALQAHAWPGLLSQAGSILQVGR